MIEPPIDEIAQLLTAAGLAGIVSIIISTIICALIILLGKIWLEKQLQSQITDNEAKLKSIQAELDKSNHVHRIQFEKEFQIYEEIWSKLLELRNKTLSLRPVMDTYNPNETEEDRKKRRLDDFSEAVNEFTKIFHTQQPFYPQEIFDYLAEIRTITFKEAIGYKNKNIDRDDYWEEVERNHDRILENIETVLKLIRQRIGSLKISK